MFNYIAVVWNPVSESECAAASRINTKMQSHPDWRSALDIPGLRVYCTDVRPGSSEVHRLTNGAGSGVVLGCLFKRDAPRSLLDNAFDTADAERTLESRGRYLISHYWGRYVAFLSNSCDRSVAVVRSPSCSFDCLSSTIQGVRVYFSSMRSCPLLQSQTYTINWDYVAADMAVQLPERRETGLHEIERVLRGECALVRGGERTYVSYWEPRQFVVEGTASPAAELIESVRQVTSTCVHAWASRYSSVLIQLSGGLDSSIIAGLLRSAPVAPRVTCVNYRNPSDAISDERSYARIVAQFSGYPLLERELPHTFSLEPILETPITESPWLNFHDMGETARRVELTRSCKAEAYFSGHGGDELFFNTASLYMCADAVHRYGFRWRVLQSALTAARLTRGAIWPTLSQGVREGLQRDPLSVALKCYQVSPLLTPEASEHVRTRRLYVPSWLENTNGVPPGKCLQILTLALPGVWHNIYSPDDDAEIVYPLLSEPLIELCLRIPTELFVYGGRARGMARKAFEQDVPAEILGRRGKGATYEYIKVICAENRRFVAELLTDGVLVAQGILDRRKLAKALAGEFSKDTGSAVELSSVICAEAWARRWTACRAKFAA